MDRKQQEVTIGRRRVFGLRGMARVPGMEELPTTDTVPCQGGCGKTIPRSELPPLASGWYCSDECHDGEISGASPDLKQRDSQPVSDEEKEVDERGAS